MAVMQETTKRLAIDKANTQTVIVVSIAAFVTVFCLVAAHAIWGQTRYQARVTNTAEVAKQKLTSNIKAFNQLEASYAKFNSASTNVINGSASGSGINAGSNATIILDALPDTYDFPALTSSLEKILKNGHYDIGGISGTDAQATEGSNTVSSNPQPVSMPFTISISNASYTSANQLITTLQQSIRPIQIDTLSLTGSNSSMTLSVTAHTFYQPGKQVSITQKVVK